MDHRPSTNDAAPSLHGSTLGKTARNGVHQLIGRSAVTGAMATIMQ